MVARTPSSNLPGSAPEGCVAQVRAVLGTWAELWFPETGEILWVDLAEIDYRFTNAPVTTKPASVAATDA